MDFACAATISVLRRGHLLRAVREGVVLHLCGAWRMRLPMTAPAVEALWQEMHAPLLRFITRRVSDPGDAEDVLQDVMVRIQRHAGEIDGVENVGAWVHQVTRSAVFDFYRRRAARPEQPAGASVDLDDFQTEAALDDSVPPSDVRTELAQCLRPLIERLPDKYREALELTEFDGLSQVAAAERVGVSTSGMKARVQRARSQLRDGLLACCDVHLDQRGGVADYHSRGRGCEGCSPGQPPSEESNARIG